MRRGWLIAAACLCAVALDPSGIGGQTRDPFTQRTGSNVVPIFEGWYKNPDGTVSLSFGYLNRNYEEEVDIVVGAMNRIEPGPQDQGQPTHFYPRRQRGVFAVQLPADAANKKITWTLSVHGQTASVPANFGELYNVDALRSEGLNRIPPGLKLEAAGQPGVGPAGTRTARRIVFPNTLTVDSWLVDTEAASRSQSSSRPRRHVTLTWSKYRGPGTVTFSPHILSVGPVGTATSSVAFSEPGEYTVRVLAMGDEMENPTAQTFQCCWTNGYVQVSVERAR